MLGSLHGKQVKWYENGKVNIETHYKDGLEDGTKTIWEEDGKLFYKGRYLKGSVI